MNEDKGRCGKHRQQISLSDGCPACAQEAWEKVNGAAFDAATAITNYRLTIGRLERERDHLAGQVEEYLRVLASRRP
jgi:hypothetical protein